MRSFRTSQPYGLIALACLIVIAAALSFATPVHAKDSPGDPASRYHSLFNAISAVESSNNPNIADHTDAGTVAIGAYQIHEAYWIDSKTPGKWTDCHNAAYSRTVIINYWRRYCPAALSNGDLRTLAMTHHGGPNGSNDSKYWGKIVVALSDQDEHHVASIFDF